MGNREFVIKRIVCAVFIYINFSILILSTHCFNSIEYIHIAGIFIPKAGSNLLLKTLRLIEGTMRLIDGTPIKFITQPPRLWLIDDNSMNDFFSYPRFLTTHAIYIDENINHLSNNTIKTVFIYRDPRDQIVSTAFMVKKLPKVWPLHSQWELSSIIDELIVGGGTIWTAVFESNEPWINLRGIGDFYALYLPWRLHPFVYTTTFEKLVGPLGGGNEVDQINEVIAIAKHMCININQEQAHIIARKIYGGTITFREGQIGSWKKYFLERHIIAFKTAHNGAGQKLLELLGYEINNAWGNNQQSLQEESEIKS